MTSRRQWCLRSSESGSFRFDSWAGRFGIQQETCGYL